jgi:hypothetical protein
VELGGAPGRVRLQSGQRHIFATADKGLRRGQASQLGSQLERFREQCPEPMPGCAAGKQLAGSPFVAGGGQAGNFSLHQGAVFATDADRLASAEDTRDAGALEFIDADEVWRGRAAQEPGQFAVGDQMKATGQ